MKRETVPMSPGSSGLLAFCLALIIGHFLACLYCDSCLILTAAGGAAWGLFFGSTLSGAWDHTPQPKPKIIAFSLVVAIPISCLATALIDPNQFQVSGGELVVLPAGFSAAVLVCTIHRLIGLQKLRS